MNDKEVLEALEKLRKISKKRNFNQSIDIVITLKNLNLKKPEENINTFISLPHSKGKKARICALVGKELAPKAKEVCDNIILKEDFSKYDKKAIKKLAKDIDFFIAQADIIGAIATAFGKILGPIGKMPNPKAGCIIPPGIADLKPLITQLDKTIKLETKNELAVKTVVGSENMKDEEIKDNIIAVYNSLLHSLPQEQNNVKDVLIKFTMSKSIKIGAKEDQEGIEKKKKEPKVENERV